MSKDPASSSALHSPSSTPSSHAPHRIDHHILIAIMVPVIGIALIGFIIYIIVRFKKWRPDAACGPYEGIVVHPEHIAAQITPFGGSGPHRGRNIPRFIHTPGEDMRIAFRRPDGAWHFADSLTPFTPAGVNDIDIRPPPSSSSSSSTTEISFNAPSKEREIKAGRETGYGFSNPIVHPPPAYRRESCHHCNADRYSRV